MRAVATGLLCWATAAAALEASPVPPVLPAKAATLAGFVPAGWQIEQRHPADFNRDGRADALLLLQPVPDPAAAAGTGRSPPRVLAVLLRGRGGWVLAERNDRLVPQVDLSSQEDPLANGEITVRPGGFTLSLGLAATMGSYQAATLRYRFRHEGGCLRLIGYDRLEVHRATLDTQDLSINYLTGAVLHTTGNAQTEASQQRRERLPPTPRLCLRDLDDAARFKPL
jgi:hypothetical protein